MAQELVDLVLSLLPEVAAEQEIALPAALGPDTVLFGAEGILDSLALVNLVVALEQAIEDQLGRTVALADEKAMSQKHSPYRTIGSLAAYAKSVLDGDV
jgi:acyl carrier protein